MEGASNSDKFTEELRWCITQLELGLQRQSPDSRKVSESIKLLKILKSQKAPMVKKRQAMRNAFGDYRKKMKDAENRSLLGLRRSRFQPMTARKSTKASQFLRMSYSKQRNVEQVPTDLDKNLSNLHLETSVWESKASVSHKAENQVEELFHQNGFVNSAGACLENNLTSDSVDSLGPTCIDNVISHSQSSGVISLPGLHIKPGPSSAPQLSKLFSQFTSSSLDKGSSGTSRFSLEQASASSSLHISGSQRSCSNNFHYAPSDNSFIFGFENIETSNDVDKQEATTTEDEVLVAGKMRQKVQDGEKNDTVSFKYEKSGNEFCFNFEEPTNEF